LGIVWSLIKSGFPKWITMNPQVGSRSIVESEIETHRSRQKETLDCRESRRISCFTNTITPIIQGPRELHFNHIYMCCLLLKRMQLTCTARVESLNTHDDGRGENIQILQILSKTWVSITGWPSLHWSPFVRFFVYTSLKSNFCITLTTQNTTENYCIISQAQNTTALQPNVFLTTVHGLLVTNKEGSAFPSAKHCQIQL
jgi:hypothetical protein